MHFVDERALAFGKIISVEDRERAIDLDHRLRLDRGLARKHSRTVDLERFALISSRDLHASALGERIRTRSAQGQKGAVGKLQLDVAM